MNRIIKFRVWDKTNKLMTYDAASLENDGVKIGNYSTELEEWDLIWMQYTGLKDKNGKEIYEGDICKFNPQPEDTVQFHGLAYINNNKVGGSWKIIECNNEGGEEWLDSSSFWNDDFELIGNIYEDSPQTADIYKYENPELLAKNI